MGNTNRSNVATSVTVALTLIAQIKHSPTVNTACHCACQSQSNDRYRGPTELIQNFSNRGSSQRGKGAARHTIDVVWLFRSALPVGMREILFIIRMIFTCPRNAYRGGGGDHHAVLSREGKTVVCVFMNL